VQNDWHDRLLSRASSIHIPASQLYLSKSNLIGILHHFRINANVSQEASTTTFCISSHFPAYYCTSCFSHQLPTYLILLRPKEVCAQFLFIHFNLCFPFKVRWKRLERLEMFSSGRSVLSTRENNGNMYLHVFTARIQSADNFLIRLHLISCFPRTGHLNRNVC
jgi:hypothetical protein